MYKIVEGEDKTEIKDAGGEVCLECYPGALGPPHDAAGGSLRNVAAGQYRWSNDDTKFATHLGYWAARKTRSVLPYATLNNVMSTSEHDLCYFTPKKTIREKESQMAPKALLSMAETVFSQCAFPGGEAANFALQMAIRERAARQVKGVVCSLVSHVSMGYLTIGSPPDTEAAIVYHGFDHSFVVFRYQTSPWMVLDPWVQNPYIVPWNYCCFDRARIQNNFRIVIKKKCETPYGFMVADEVESGDMAVSTADWIAACRLAGLQDDPSNYADREFLEVTKINEDWNRVFDPEQRSKYPWFHTDHTWGQQHNLEESHIDYTSGHMDHLRPCCGPDAWGPPGEWSDVTTLGETRGD